MAKGLIEGGSNFLRDTLTAEVSKTFQTMLQNTQQQSILDAQLDAAKENKKLEIDTTLLSNAMVNAGANPDSALILLKGYLDDPQMSDPVRPVVQSNIALVESYLKKGQEIQDKFDIYKNMKEETPDEIRAKEDYKRTNLLPSKMSPIPYVKNKVTSLLDNDVTSVANKRDKIIDVIGLSLKFDDATIKGLKGFGAIPGISDEQFDVYFNSMIDISVKEKQTEDMYKREVLEFLGSRNAELLIEQGHKGILDHLKEMFPEIVDTPNVNMGLTGGGSSTTDSPIMFSIDEKKYPEVYNLLKTDEAREEGFDPNNVNLRDLVRLVDVSIDGNDKNKSFQNELLNLKKELEDYKPPTGDDSSQEEKPTGPTGFSISQVDVKGSGRRSGEREMVRLRTEGKGVLGEKNNKINII